MAEVLTPQFWVGLLTVISINIILSGDNAVVIAMAAHSLPARQQRQAIVWGAAGAVVLRIVLAIIAVETLRLPVLKLVGGILLLWIAIKLLIPEGGDDHGPAKTHSSWSAIRTIIVADVVMSMDNVLAVAAAAKGSMLLLSLGLLISIPCVVFGAAVLMQLMERWPIIVTLGAAILGWTAGEIGIEDSVVAPWLDGHVFLQYLIPALGAALVVAVGKWAANRAQSGEDTLPDLSD